MPIPTPDDISSSLRPNFSTRIGVGKDERSITTPTIIVAIAGVTEPPARAKIVSALNNTTLIPENRIISHNKSSSEAYQKIAGKT